MRSANYENLCDVRFRICEVCHVVDWRLASLWRALVSLAIFPYFSNLELTIPVQRIGRLDKISNAGGKLDRTSAPACVFCEILPAEHRLRLGFTVGDDIACGSVGFIDVRRYSELVDGHRCKLALAG